MSPKNLDLYLIVVESKFVTAIPRKDILVKAGHPIIVSIEKKHTLIEYAKELAKKLRLKSCFNLEGFYKNNIFTMNEINMRFGSGIIFSYLAGINFPAHILGIENQEGKDFKEGLYTNILGARRLNGTPTIYK